jgi:hypothetical protein
MKENGRILDLTESRVCQLLTQAIVRLPGRPEGFMEIRSEIRLVSSPVYPNAVRGQVALAINGKGGWEHSPIGVSERSHQTEAAHELHRKMLL